MKLVIKKFQDNYNRFIDDNPEILEDEETKDELHQKLEELQDKLWAMVEAK